MYSNLLIGVESEHYQLFSSEYYQLWVQVKLVKSIQVHETLQEGC